MDWIVFEIDHEPTVALLRLQKGEVDVLDDGIPPAQFLEVRDNSDYADMIIEGGQLQTGHITLKVTMPSFDNLSVRKAINMAINKDRIVRIINNRAVIANQPLPPSMPGYTEGYEGIPYDVEAAKALLAEACFPDGFANELYVYNVDPNPRIAQAIQQDLAAIGVTVELISLAQGNVIEAGGAGTAPMIWSGSNGLNRRLPRFLQLLRAGPGLRGRRRGRLELVEILHEELDARDTAADAMIDPAKEADRYKALERCLYWHNGRRPLVPGFQ